MMTIILLLLCILLCTSIYVFFPKPPKDYLDTYDAILILGCPANEDGTISLPLQERCDYALYLYHSEMAPLMIVSGAAVKNKYAEADIMEQYLKGKEPRLMIKKERTAKNSYQNISFTKKSFPYQNIFVVTSPSHLRRAYFFTKKFYPQGAVVPCKKRDSLQNYLKEYVHLWICLYHEIKSRKK